MEETGANVSRYRIHILFQKAIGRIAHFARKMTNSIWGNLRKKKKNDKMNKINTNNTILIVHTEMIFVIDYCPRLGSSDGQHYIVEFVIAMFHHF